MLPELDALGALLEANEEWQQDAAGVRSRMLVILGSVADRYEAKGLPFVKTLNSMGVIAATNTMIL